MSDINAGVIRRLDAVTIGHIAAGEVIERPVSVVKELVENALDAGAGRIYVALRGGGLDAIEVIDDGSGIAASDLRLALERHATSKLSGAAGLEALSTLGFRGEGLASIASVARVTLQSRRVGDEFASQVQAFEEQIGAVEVTAGPVGTRVLARDLFGNVPVRREYLRSAQAETTRVAALLTALGLGYPRVSFQLHVDGRETVNLPLAQAGLDRLAHVFGRDVYQQMLVIGESPSNSSPQISGYISKPGIERGDRRQQYLFVNGRLLRSTQMASAWAAAYAGYALVGRHPFGVLLVTLPPDHLDPNVHPTKSDVRFRYTSHVLDAAKTAMVKTLSSDAQTRFGAAVSLSPSHLPNQATSLVDESNPAPQPSAPQPHFPEQTPSWQSTRRLANTVPNSSAELPLLEPPSSRFRVLAQLDQAFILASDGRGIVLVDQHAAHERVVYETIVLAALSATAENAVPIQPLLVPRIIELNHADAQALEASLDALRAVGVELEAFGERVYRLKSMPAILAARSFDVCAYIADLDEATPDLDARERVWASMACHSVVRAGETMQLSEMQTIVDRLATCANPMHCPHGRPTIVRFDAPHIARLFRR